MKALNWIAIATLCLGSIQTNAQTDAKAKSLLDDLSAKTKAYSSIKADFNYTLDNSAADIHETQSGSIAIKGDKYWLKIAGQEIHCNGKTVWTYLRDAEEVQVTEFDADNKDQITPSSIFTMYEKGFRHQFIKEEGGIAQVNIFPLDLDSKNYHTVKLYINRGKMQISKIEILGKEGDTYTYTIKSFQPNASIPETLFSFETSKHPDVEVVDLR